MKIGANNHILCSDSSFGNIPATSNGSNPICGVPLTPAYFPDCNPGGGAYTQAFGGGATGGFSDAIIVEFDQNGALQWSTYFGGQGEEDTDLYPSTPHKNYLAVNPNNPNVFYLVGRTSKRNAFPTLSIGGAYQQAPDSINTEHAFIAKFNNRQLKWSTLFGGRYTVGLEAVCDNNDNVFLVGYSQTNTYASVNCVPPSSPTEFPKCHPSGVYAQPSYGGGSTDAFIASFDSSSQLIWSTYYGGNGVERGLSVTCDNTFQRVYMTGITQSTSGFPLLDPGTGNYQQPTNGGSISTNNRDSYIARFCIDAQVFLAINEYETLNNNLLVYPNPTDNYLTVEFISPIAEEVLKIDVFNLLGELVMSRNDNMNNSSKVILDVSAYSTGVYFIQISSTKNKYIAKFIVQ